ncbi:unnamed protein product [Rhizoctonia solani]|uniref:Uncharacterized protein n=1 Tax=Rhizoctonia solani TaxID=456999 RepID=A0A8H2WBL3_9AGAM|nr:unnamed protein product [Rhizoctonia solani]
MFRWAYFLTYEELVNRHQKCGGKLGTFNPRNAQDVQHARRAIFKYLLPGTVRVWDALLGVEPGVVFFVGKSIRDPHEAFKRDLASRCYKAFGRAPDPCEAVPGSEGLWWDHYSRDDKKCRLKLGEFLASDTEGDMYPLSPLQLAALTSSDK